MPHPPRPLRLSLALPPAELEWAADLLEQAAEALLSGDEATAAVRLREANSRTLHAHGHLLMNGADPVIHRIEAQPDAPPRVPKPKRATIRMPTNAEQDAVYRRDGYRCRYCGCRIVLKEARAAFTSMLPDAAPWPGDDKGKHGAFYALNGCVDHLVPHARGGDNDLANLVTACWPCNFGKWDFLIEELGLADPRLRPPVVDAWDGLARIVPLRRRDLAPKLIPADKPRKTTARPVGPETPPESPEAWFARLDEACGPVSSRLKSFLGALDALGLTWSLKKALVIRVTRAGKIYDVVGFEPDGVVQVPWMIRDAKAEYKPFAITLSQAITGSVHYETRTMWRVKGADGPLRVDQILEVEDVVLEGLERLRRDIERAKA